MQNIALSCYLLFMDFSRWCTAHITQCDQYIYIYIHSYIYIIFILRPVAVWMLVSCQDRYAHIPVPSVPFFFGGTAIVAMAGLVASSLRTFWRSSTRLMTAQKRRSPFGGLKWSKPQILPDTNSSPLKNGSCETTLLVRPILRGFRC